jgi:hypothetical protein
MDKLLADLASPYFWLTAGLFALIVNIASSYLKTPMDRAFGRVSNSWLLRTKRQQLRLEELTAAVEDPEYRAYLRWVSMMTVADVFLQMLFCFASSAGLLVMGTIVRELPWVGFVTYLMGASLAFSTYRLIVGLRQLALQERALHWHEQRRQP